MDDIRTRINRRDILIADGALGTILLEKGFKFDNCLEELNLSHPEIIEEIAAGYFEAGADIIQTNSFGGSPLKLGQYSLDKKAEQINREAVRIVRKVVGDSAYVSGSCGPSGRILIPYGDTEPEVVYDSYLRQMRALVDGGVDVICIETMTDITEASLAIRAARATSPTIPILATMTFDPTPKGFFTIMGVTVEKAAKELKKAGADVIGSNCGHGIELMVKIAKEFRTHSKMPLMFQANAGLPETVDGKIVYNESPEFTARTAQQLVSLGVSIIGGCCGTTPKHTTALRIMVDSF